MPGPPGYILHILIVVILHNVEFALLPFAMNRYLLNKFL